MKNDLPKRREFGIWTDEFGVVVFILIHYYHFKLTTAFLF